MPDFTNRLRTTVSEVYLQEVCQRYQAELGYFAGREFVAELVLLEQSGQYLVDHAMVY